MKARHLLCVCLVLGGALASRVALAICMDPYQYRASIDGNSVIVVPDNPKLRVCKMGKSDAMLRQNIATGEVVRMPDRCSGEGWLDECVPKGGYRYGFATPYACCMACCHTDFFVEVLINQDPPADCVRADDNPAPTPSDSGVPWSGVKEICGYTAAPDAAATPASTDTDGGASAQPGKVSGGCSMMIQGSGTSAGVATLCGLLLATVLFVRTSRGRRRL